jgi:hypothetical protein
MRGWGGGGGAILNEQGRGTGTLMTTLGRKWGEGGGLWAGKHKCTMKQSREGRGWSARHGTRHWTTGRVGCVRNVWGGVSRRTARWLWP